MSNERLTLIEQPCLEVPQLVSGTTILSAGSLAAYTTVVVGVRLRSRPDLYLRNYSPNEQQIRRELQVRAAHARRLEEFFWNHMATPADHGHDDESIIRYMLGMDIATTHAPERWRPLEYAEGSRNALDLSRGYALLNKAGNANCFVYGVNEPALCLTALGLGEPLVVTPVSELAEFHRSERITEITTKY